jgi:hypothetical protein
MHLNSRLKALAAAAVVGLVPAVIAMAGANGTNAHGGAPTGLIREVRIGTAAFRDVDNALAAGYVSADSCVSGPEVGAMGIHYPNGPLVGDGVLDPRRPEALMYEQKNGRLRLVGVEFIVLAADWDAAHPGAPPVLLGQHFNLVGSPNRYGLPAFYELHVWAWRDNPNGTFVDWNPAVSCDEFVGGSGGHSAALHGVHH